MRENRRHGFGGLTQQQDLERCAQDERPKHEKPAANEALARMLAHRGRCIHDLIGVVHEMEAPKARHVMHRAVIDVIEEIEQDEHEAVLDPGAGWQQGCQSPVMRGRPMRHAEAHGAQQKLRRQGRHDEHGVDARMTELLPLRLGNDDVFDQPQSADENSENKDLRRVGVPDEKLYHGTRD